MTEGDGEGDIFPSANSRGNVRGHAAVVDRDGVFPPPMWRGGGGGMQGHPLASAELRPWGPSSCPDRPHSTHGGWLPLPYACACRQEVGVFELRLDHKIALHMMTTSAVATSMRRLAYL